MSAVLDPRTADRLAKVCGLFGSDHHGERAAAAALADRLVRQSGLSWKQILLPGHSSVEELISFALDHGDEILNAWEWGFLQGIRGRQYLTEKQLRKLDALVGKVKAARCAA
jgi:hypothetical protein